jgi:anionic cell wall polymer biosynthesis LytR-Cps2A-Psr (LCP) family protein
LIAAVGGYAILSAGLNALNTSVTTAHLLVTNPSTEPKVVGNTIKGPLNLLMVGVDASGQNTDSIIIAHIPASHDQIYLVSIPRDTDVVTLSGGHNKINSQFSGPSPMARLQQTIDKNWGIPINAAAIVNFSGFGDIVNKLGGITMYVDETTYSIHHGYLHNNPKDRAPGYPFKINPNTGVPICSKPGVIWGPSTAQECTLPGITDVVYPKGMYTFNGYSALDFVRCRDGLVGTDFARQRHQQQFIKAVMDKVYAQGMSDPFKMLGLLKSLSKAFTFDGNGVSITDWVLTLDKIQPSDLVTIKTNDGQFDTLPNTGNGSEQGLTADSLKLFADLKNDSDTTDLLSQFVATHPDWVANS